jgi:hypothetical protein
MSSVLPIVHRMTKLSCESSMNAHWTEEDLEDFSHFSLVVLVCNDQFVLVDSQCFCCTALGDLIFVE